TIIESGIDIPNANTLIINRADHFGLADLHQLRGRVGRSKVKAYAYFIVPPAKVLTSVAQSRIDAIEKFNGLGAGFHIAFEDLQLRGAGNLLGQEQHGYITNIGFDLYCRLLKESVLQLKKDPKNIKQQRHISNEEALKEIHKRRLTENALFQ
ncbi:helicase-related protein, partial [Candidatus Omnitrophota bacterium]